MPPGTAPPAGPPAKGGGGKLGAWIKKNPGPAAAAGVVGLLGAFFLIKKGQANSAGAAGTGATSTVGTVDPSLYGTPSDLGGSGGFLGNTSDASAIEGQLTALQALLQQITVQQAPPQKGGGGGSGGGGGGGKGGGGGGKKGYQPNQKHWLTGAQYQELKKAGKGHYGAPGGRYTGARGWAWLQKHPVK
jgi:hypothetical protein